MYFKPTLLALAALLTVTSAFPQWNFCPEDAKCTDKGAVKCHRFGHGTAVYECKHRCFGARDVCYGVGGCTAEPTAHCA